MSVDIGKDVSNQTNIPSCSNQDESVEINCVVVGEECIGKSALVHNFISPLQNINSNYNPTTRDDFLGKSNIFPHSISKTNEYVIFCTYL